MYSTYTPKDERGRRQSEEVGQGRVRHKFRREGEKMKLDEIDGDTVSDRFGPKLADPELPSTVFYCNMITEGRRRNARRAILGKLR